MRAKRRVAVLLLTPLLLIALLLAYLSSWRVQVLKTSGADAFQVTFSPDGQYLAVAAHGAVNVHEFGSIDVWRVTPPGFLRPAKLTDRRQVKVTCPASLCFSGDSTQIVSTSYCQSALTTWDVASGRRLGTADTDSYSGSFAQPWPDQNTVTYWTGSEIEQRDVSQKGIGKTPKSLGDIRSSLDDAGYNKLVAFAPSGKLIAWSSSPYDSSVNNGIQLRSVGSKQARLLPFEGCTGDDRDCEPTALAFSPDSQSVIVARTRTMYHNDKITDVSYLTLLWNVKTRRIVAQWTSKSPVNAFAFSPDGTAVAEALKDGFLHLRATTNGKLLRTSHAHRHDAMSVAFSPDGTLLASCGGDGMVRLTRVR